MTTYAIGDLHGCHAEFVELLEALDFSPARDTLWLVGDLINRGPGSLECLREVKALGNAAHCVLGNHDFHLLVAARGGGRLKRRDTLEGILAAPERETLLDWLQAQPLAVAEGNTLMAHAGVLPSWSREAALGYSREVEAALGGEHAGRFLEALYGDEPARFHADLDGMDRLRALVNVFARMRFIRADETLDFAAKEGLDSAPHGFHPWFQYPRGDTLRLLFGHWAALEGETPGARIDVHALDTGCVWGGELTAMNLETGERTSVPSRQVGG
ncbi:symmetrical bis(5'-nucleosyl)-tetraphosphatase [Vreelandella malpeensis]|uniref:bis(5'-nucleosyl)-tetraphosphatase (symmetrical) n=1 Tax=Vreelandella malpeensis TaxID=1172368 RepID=A0ABS8DSL5_9GAMM|nr:symmetrical bis(5'-nucleosyl)-tetraphosphatase [Halomonas malpeensis]MCB8888845.1 symmetrical bis(5'-nucleosyl)-tetraphosphatase [Halomonas malpeensis]